MLSEWISRVGSAIPRGFSRQYILALLREQSMTGKEIIDRATSQSGGKWKPSPGLIYPLLGRLLNEGLVADAKDGKYSITKKGVEITSDLESFGNIIHKQIEVMMRVGNAGKFMAMDVIDRISTIGSALSSNLGAMTKEERNKYRDFLRGELRKLEEQETKFKEAQREKVDDGNADASGKKSFL